MAHELPPEAGRTVRYSGASPEQADQAYADDYRIAAAGGYRVTRTWWDVERTHPTIVVEYVHERALPPGGGPVPPPLPGPPFSVLPGSRPLETLPSAPPRRSAGPLAALAAIGIVVLAGLGLVIVVTSGMGERGATAGLDPSGAPATTPAVAATPTPVAGVPTAAATDTPVAPSAAATAAPGATPRPTSPLTAPEPTSGPASAGPIASAEPTGPPVVVRTAVRDDAVEDLVDAESGKQRARPAYADIRSLIARAEGDELALEFAMAGGVPSSLDEATASVTLTVLIDTDRDGQPDLHVEVDSADGYRVRMFDYASGSSRRAGRARIDGDRVRAVVRIEGLAASDVVRIAGTTEWVKPQVDESGAATTTTLVDRAPDNEARWVPLRGG